MARGTKMVVLDDTHFNVIWLVVFVLRMATIIMLVLNIWYFHWLSQNTSHQEAWRRNVHSLAPEPMKRVVMILVLCFGLHVCSLSKMVGATIAERKLVFRRTPIVHVEVDGSYQQMSAACGSSKTWAKALARWSTRPTVAAQVFQWFSKLFAKGTAMVTRILNVFSIQSVWFTEVFVVRESIELVTQAISVFRVQCLIATHQLNWLTVWMMFLNSISTGAIELITKDPHHKRLKTRLSSILMDACLDFVFAVALPLAREISLLQHLQFSTMSFPDELMNNDVWLSNAIRQFQQFSLGSTWDILSLSVFQFGLLFCLSDVQDIMSRQDHQQTKHLDRVDPSLRESRGYLSKKSISLFVTSVSTSFQKRCQAVAIPFFKATPVVHAAIGLLVVGASCYASLATGQLTPGCKLAGYEWFRSHPVCFVMEINCFRQQIRGSGQEIHQILGAMDTRRLFSLYVSHCEALQMTQWVLELPSLYLLEIYNSSITEWEANYAVTQSTNPQLTQLRFFHTNFSRQELPDGLMAKDFPSFMSSVSLGHTNVVSLPDQVATSWNQLSSLYLDHGMLTEIPSCLGEIRSLLTISFVNNSISSIPEGLMDNWAPVRLALSKNPLPSIPKYLPLSVLSHTKTLELEHTLVSDVPEWLQVFLERVHAECTEKCQTTLYGSWICSNRFTRLLVGNASSLNSVDWLLARCGSDHFTSRGGEGLAFADLQRII